MTLSNAQFSAQGCFVTIDGWRADVSSKFSLLLAGLCAPRAVDPGDADKARDLRASPVMDESGEPVGMYACNEPRLVELAVRHWLWSQGNDFADKPAEVHADPVAAAMALQQHLSTLKPS